MSRAEMRLIYLAARRVHDRKVRREDGARELQLRLRTNLGSARDLIDTYRHLRKGEVFKRTVSAPIADYYLERIYLDIGPKALEVAVRSLQKHIAYYEGVSGTHLHTLRSVASERQGLIGRRKSELKSRKEFDFRVRKALASSRGSRRRRLLHAPKRPNRRLVSVWIYDRNPDVVAEVLVRASGNCEGCGQRAPFFKRTDHTPYLEVHHRKQLAHGGLDTVSNAIALCPNCHRRQHFG